MNKTAEERQQYFERLCAMDEQVFQKEWEQSDVYAEIQRYQAKKVDKLSLNQKAEAVKGFVAFLKTKATTRFDWNDAVDVEDVNG